MSTFLVTGAAGYIGSWTCDVLLSEGHSVIGIDNFSTGFNEFIADALKHKNFRFHEHDLLDRSRLTEIFSPHIDCVIHLAANADVRFGLNHPEKDLNQNIIVTFNVLEAMRANRIKSIAFSSTGSIYGEALDFPTKEDAPLPIQTSLYGASKLAAEGLIEAYCEGYDMQAYIFRFVSILGERYTHGHVYDFYKKLKTDPKNLEILGDGKQKKSYLYILDCVNAIKTALHKATDKINIFNLGYPDYIDVDFSAHLIAKYLKINPRFSYTGGQRGWIGDNPFIFLDVKKIMSLGWEPKVTIPEALLKTTQWLEHNEWVYEQRCLVS